jgi:hypothetical protein
MNPVGATTSTTSTTSTVMKLFLLVTACIIINIFLYLIEDKWIGGVFSGAWLLAIVLTYLYNRGFDLNITNYSLTTLLQRYFLPIVTYIVWFGVIYWWIAAQNDIDEPKNIEHSQLSRNFAVVIGLLIPVLAGVVTYYSTYNRPGAGWAILISIGLLVLGSYSYYIYTLCDGCNKNISDSICWTCAANATFLGFILITGLFIWLSTKDFVGPKKCIQFLPRTLITNPTLPLSIFSIVIYLMMWISFVIVSFRHDKKLGDEMSSVVNKAFTQIGILMFFLLLFKETEYMRNNIMYIFKQPLSTTLLHASIIITFLVSISYTTTYLKSNIYKSDIGGIWSLYIILWLLFTPYVYSLLSSSFGEENRFLKFQASLGIVTVIFMIVFITYLHF